MDSGGIHYLIEQKVRISGIGPIGLGGILFQNVRLVAEFFHQGYDHAVAVICGGFIVHGRMVQGIFQPFYGIIGSIAG